ncbi:hypothetical protein H2198_007149 [Neophaeococcomyces mojaviensis]|uniref:Uncharacterized protein n=1 Tax=Neophaeococcomyces mojaviensis TaxID=3383035 RepID=A0ACC3A0R9_9EURO|nr:hypothetical protein H2198_007149 [Knufia sp. JES_112]
MQVAELQQELINRRLLDIGYHYLEIRKSYDLNKSDTFDHELNNVRDQLVAYYKEQGDEAEANRILFYHKSNAHYLDKHTVDTVASMAKRLKEALTSVFADMGKRYRDMTKSSLETTIEPCHLAILGRLPQDQISQSWYAQAYQPDILGRNGLHLAAEVGDTLFLKSFLADTSQPWVNRVWTLQESRDVFGLTPLMVAIYMGYADIFELLIENGGKTSIPDELGGSSHYGALKTLFRTAIESGNPEMLKLLLKNIKLFGDTIGQTSQTVETSEPHELIRSVSQLTDMRDEDMDHVSIGIIEHPEIIVLNRQDPEGVHSSRSLMNLSRSTSRSRVGSPRSQISRSSSPSRRGYMNRSRNPTVRCESQRRDSPSHGKHDQSLDIADGRVQGMPHVINIGEQFSRPGDPIRREPLGNINLSGGKLRNYLDQIFEELVIKGPETQKPGILMNGYCFVCPACFVQRQRFSDIRTHLRDKHNMSCQKCEEHRALSREKVRRHPQPHACDELALDELFPKDAYSKYIRCFGGFSPEDIVANGFVTNPNSIPRKRKSGITVENIFPPPSA